MLHFYVVKYSIRQNTDYFYLPIFKETLLYILQHDKGTFILAVWHPLTRLILEYRDKLNKKYYYDEIFKRYPEMRNYPSQYGKWKQ